MLGTCWRGSRITLAGFGRAWYVASMATMIDLEHVFTYHPPQPGQQDTYEKLRSSAKEFARTITELVPACADQSAAIRHVREALMTANAAIALGGKLY